MQAADFRNAEAMHIVYVLCWNRREDEFLTSLKSLHLFAEISLKEEPGYYHVHVITNEPAVSGYNNPTQSPLAHHEPTHASSCSLCLGEQF